MGEGLPLALSESKLQLQKVWRGGYASQRLWSWSWSWSRSRSRDGVMDLSVSCWFGPFTRVLVATRLIGLCHVITEFILFYAIINLIYFFMY